MRVFQDTRDAAFLTWDFLSQVLTAVGALVVGGIMLFGLTAFCLSVMPSSLLIPAIFLDLCLISLFWDIISGISVSLGTCFGQIAALIPAIVVGLVTMPIVLCCNLLKGALNIIEDFLSLIPYSSASAPIHYQPNLTDYPPREGGFSLPHKTSYHTQTTQASVAPEEQLKPAPKTPIILSQTSAQVPTPKSLLMPAPEIPIIPTVNHLGAAGGGGSLPGGAKAYKRSTT